MLPTTGGAVDLSGVIGWLMRRYDTVLAEYQRHVTGDPAALRQTAGTYRGSADRAAGIAVDLLGRSRTSARDWQGTAYQAFDGAVTRLGGRVDVTEHRLRRQATAVETAASALDQASKNVADVRTRFSAQAQLLVSSARAVPVWQLGTVIMQARRFGDEAVANAKAVHTQLGGTLSTVAAELVAASGNAAANNGTRPGTPGTPEQARAAAKSVREVLDGDAAPSELRKAMTELRGVTDRVHAARAAGQEPSAADTAYLSAFYNELGDRVYELPAYIKAGEHEWDTFLGFFGKTEPGFNAADQQTMLGTLGNGVVALSHHPEQLSPALRDLVTTPASSTEVGAWPTLAPSAANVYQAVGIPHLDRFEAMRDMLGAADPNLAMGTEFSTGLTQRVGEMADVTGQLHDPTNTITDDRLNVVPEQAAMHDKPRMDNLMGGLLDASTRNHAADAAVMADATTMQRLSTYDWTDNGAAAAKVIDWIPPALASSDPAAQQLARESYLTLAQTVTDTGTGADGNSGPLAPMLRGVDTNEALSNAFARNNAANIGLFAHTTGGGDTNLATMQLSSDDARHMIMLGSYTPEGRDMTSMAAHAYQAHQLDLAGNREISPELAGRRAGNVIGLTTAGMENAIWEDAVATKSDADAANQELYRRQIGIANLAKDLGGLPLSTVPGGSVFGVVYDHSMQSVIDRAIPEPQAVPAHVLPDNRLATPLHNADAGKFMAAYDVAAHVHQHNPGAVPAEALVATSPTDATPRVLNSIEVSSPFARAQNDMVEWARDQPAYREYVDTFHEQVNFAYRDNVFTQTGESITNDIHGRRPHQ